MKFYELKTGQRFRFETDTIADEVRISKGVDGAYGRHINDEMSANAYAYYCSPNDAVIPLGDKP